MLQMKLDDTLLLGHLASMSNAIAVILSSAFSDLDGLASSQVVRTPFGDQTVYPYHRDNGPAYVIFRHGRPHTILPHQINWRATAAALKTLDVGALLVTSSVGVLDASVPLNTPLVVRDLLMPDNRLPDGTLATMFVEPSPQQGHLVLQGGLFDPELCGQLEQLGATDHAICFAYAPGPRTKTPAENIYWARLGAHVNSMTLGPEVVLANELEIPCAGLVVGHKYSHPDIVTPSFEGIANSLEDARAQFEKIVLNWLRTAQPVPFKNMIFRFNP